MEEVPLPALRCSPLLATMTFLMGLYSRRRTFGEAAGAVEVRRMPRSFRPPHMVLNLSIWGGNQSPSEQTPSGRAPGRAKVPAAHCSPR